MDGDAQTAQSSSGGGDGQERGHEEVNAFSYFNFK